MSEGEVKVELLFAGTKGKEPKQITVDVNPSLKGTRWLNAIDRAVEKATKGTPDEDWTRWNLA